MALCELNQAMRNFLRSVGALSWILRKHRMDKQFQRLADIGAQFAQRRDRRAAVGLHEVFGGRILNTAERWTTKQ